MTTPITRRDIIAQQSVAPWPNRVQVEQDLVVCRGMTALFEDAFLQSQIALRAMINANHQVLTGRLANQWSQAGLAERMGISRAAVSAIEGAPLSPSVATGSRSAASCPRDRVA